MASSRKSLASRAGAAALRVVTGRPAETDAATEAAEESSVKKAPAKKTSGKKAPARKSTAKKTPADKVAKTAARKAAAKTTAAKKTPATKAAAQKTATSPVKKVPAPQTPAGQAPTKKAGAKKAPATKTPAKKAPVTDTVPTETTQEAAAPVETPAPPASTVAALTHSADDPVIANAPVDEPPRTKAVGGKTVKGARKGTPGSLVVLESEEPWTKEELDEVRAHLRADITRLTDELQIAEEDLAGLLRDAGEGAGNDQADVGSASFERDQEVQIANNARDMLEGSVHALDRIAAGTYGICESRGEPIGKNRLMVFPRATLCLSCKQREERR